MRIFLRLVLIVLGLGGWAVAGVLGLIVYGFIYKPWDDSISLANRHTGELLALHEKDDQTRQVVDWLTAYRGEAPGHQVMISFVAWSLNHQEATEAILSSDITEPTKLVERLAFAASDSGDGCKFRAAFAQSAVPLIVSTLGEIKRIQRSDGCELGVAPPNKIQTRLPAS